MPRAVFVRHLSLILSSVRRSLFPPRNATEGVVLKRTVIVVLKRTVNGGGGVVGGVAVVGIPDVGSLGLCIGFGSPQKL